MKLYSIFFCAVLFVTALLLRPVLPIDETRYMTVSWEMYLHYSYFLPTLNFEPYHHKPPLMFWLINLSWTLFGVSRATALIPFFCVAVGLVFLIQKLSYLLFPERPRLHTIMPFLTLGSLPFVLYSTIIMFDLLLTVCVLGTLIAFLSYAERPVFKTLLVAGLWLGLAGLTKGPVALIHTLFPLAFYPYWRLERHQVSPRLWTKGLCIGLVIGLIVLGFWLINMFLRVDPTFLYNILWKQTAGRVTGTMESAHARPFYFFVPLLPLLFLPWAFFPSFWKHFWPSIKTWPQDGRRFLIIWLLGAFILFSLISGKQPHYLVPLMVPALILTGLTLEQVSLHKLKIVTASMLTLFVIGHSAAHITGLFKPYDLTPLAQYIKTHEKRDWAFVRKYQGELGFLGRFTHHVDSIELYELDAWFQKHPTGLAIVRHNPKPDVPHYKEIMVIPYRSKAISIYAYEPVHKNPPQ